MPSEHTHSQVFMRLAIDMTTGHGTRETVRNSRDRGTGKVCLHSPFQTQPRLHMLLQRIVLACGSTDYHVLISY